MSTTTTPQEWTSHGRNYQRPLGSSEFAFFPASKDGLGDMFLHIAFRAPKDIMRRSRVTVAWAIIRGRHPLLMSKVVMDGEDANNPRFSLTPPATTQDALDEAAAALHFRDESKDALIFNFMNGPRTLSNNHLSYLVISKGNEPTAENDGEYDLLMCAPHFLGDGTSLHQSTHELLSLLASPMSDLELSGELFSSQTWGEILPPAFETRLPVQGNKFVKAVSKVNYLQTLQREIGGHSFSRTQRGPQRTILVERTFTEAQTATILARCKYHNVTINHAVFALCNVAWGRCITKPQSTQLPMMMYTAINLRPHLSPHTASTNWFLALTYFNIVLPAFLPATAAVFWARAQDAKKQTRRTVQSQFLVPRTLEMAESRASRARGIVPPANPSLFDSPPLLPPAPSSALMGLSLIGNLDSIYTRGSYPSIQLHSVMTASRQKAGGLLLLEHTFGKKLCLHLCWDENGFEEGHVDKFWMGLQAAVEEFLT